MTHPRLALLLVAALFAVGCPGPVEPPCEGDACADAGGEPTATECDPNPCIELNRGVCTVEGEGHRCSCNPGYLDEAGRCELDDPCAPNPCTEANRTVCVASGSNTTCECDPGFELDLGVCVPVETHCQTEHEDGDVFEPDECAGKATHTGPQGVQGEAHTLEPAGDQDWFRVATMTGTVYRFSVASQGLHLSAKVFASDGVTELATQSSTAPVLTVRAPNSEALYFRVRANSPTTVGPYTVTIEPIGFDDHGDSIYASSSWTPSVAPTSGNIDYDGDTDWFSFNAVEAHVYAIGCGDGSCGVRVYGPSGTAVDRVNGASLSQAVLKLAAGRYHFQLFALNGEPGPYTFSLEDRGLDDRADSVAGATGALPVGADQLALIDYEGDVDVHVLNATAAHIYEITCAAGSTLTECNLQLLDSSEVVLASDVRKPNTTVRFKAPTTGAWFVKVNATDVEVGGYTVRVNDLGVDDFGDTIAAASPLMGPLPVAVNGRLELRDDEDVFSFQAITGRTYVASCTPTTAWTCVVQFLDTDGSVESFASGGVAYFAPLSAGTFYIRVRASGPATPGDYALSLSEVVDDHGKAQSNATPVTLISGSASGTGNIETPGDTDVLSFSATAGTYYRVSCTRAGVSDCMLAVMSASGTLLADNNGSDALLIFKAPSTDTFFLRFSSMPGATGAYDWLIEETAIVDDHGDDLASATPVTFTAGAANGTGQLEISGDRDLFKFPATAGKIYRFTCTPTFVDCNLSVRSAADQHLAGDTNNGASEVFWEADATADFFVRVSGSSGNVGAYDWRFEETVLVDDHGDDITTATQVTLSGGMASSTASLEIGGDQDFFRFSAQAGVIYRVGCAPSGMWSCTVSLRDSTGGQLASVQQSPVLWEAPATGDFYLRISSFSSGTTGAYVWSLEQTTATDDHSDEGDASATLLSVGGAPVSGNIDAMGDLDFFQVTLTAGMSYTVANPQVGGVNLTLRVIEAASGSNVAFGAPPKSFTPSVSGIHYVRVQSQSTPQTGAYQLAITSP